MNPKLSNPYLELTERFNEGGRIRAIVCSGQAVVLHGLAVMSKDGDWILREEQETLRYVLGVLDGFGATYRFGAPLALPWMRMGWSSHLEFYQESLGLRIRTDFFTRPPRIALPELSALWAEADEKRAGLPVTDLVNLARLKQTNRERDYAVIGEIARRLPTPEDQILWSRSAQDLIELSETHRELTEFLGGKERPLLTHALAGDRDALEEALDRERRSLMRLNEDRLAAMQELMAAWKAVWPTVRAETMGLPLLDAHQVLVDSARGVLPSG